MHLYPAYENIVLITYQIQNWKRRLNQKQKPYRFPSKFPNFFRPSSYSTSRVRWNRIYGGLRKKHLPSLSRLTSFLAAEVIVKDLASSNVYFRSEILHGCTHRCLLWQRWSSNPLDQRSIWRSTETASLVERTLTWTGGTHIGCAHLQWLLKQTSFHIIRVFYYPPLKRIMWNLVRCLWNHTGKALSGVFKTIRRKPSQERFMFLSTLLSLKSIAMFPEEVPGSKS